MFLLLALIPPAISLPSAARPAASAFAVRGAESRPLFQRSVKIRERSLRNYPRLRAKEPEANDKEGSRIIDTELVRWVKERIFTDPGGPFLRDPASLRPDVKLSNPLWRMQGKNHYVKSATSWFANSEAELPEVQVKITELVEPVIGRNTVRIRWETSWVPPNMKWWARVRKIFPENFEIDPFSIGEPKAVMFGVTSMEFQNNATETGSKKYILVKQTEQLELDKIFSPQRISKRRQASRIYEDLVIFLATRRPIGWNAKEWASRILAMLDLSSISRSRLAGNSGNAGGSGGKKPQLTRRGQLGVGLGLVAGGCATLAGSALRKRLALYDIEKELIEGLIPTGEEDWQ